MKLNTLKVKNFTLFSDEVFEFVPGINVIIGDNATGKSHLLKLLYSITGSLQPVEREELAKNLTNKLNHVFFTQQDIKQLRRFNSGRDETQVKLAFQTANEGCEHLQFSYTYNTQKHIKLEGTPPIIRQTPSVIFIPAHEVLSLHPWLINLYQEKSINLSEVYYDLCLKFLSPPVNQLDDSLAALKTELEILIGGQVDADEQGVFINNKGKGKLRAGLIADGASKLAGLIFLIKNGSLHNKSILFWDEVDAHLNPKTIVVVAKALMILVQNGLQIFISTHSFFMMKELSHLAAYQYPDHSIRFFNITLNNEIEVGEKLSALHNIQSLNAILDQDDREQALFYQQTIKN